MSKISLHPCGHCLRFALVLWNILVVLIGLVLLGVGIWQLVENDNYSELNGQSAGAAAGVSIAGGVVAIGVALLGIIGAIALSRILLGIYAAIVVIFIILELASGITGFIYRDNLEDTVSDNAERAIRNYYNSSTDRRIIDEIQDDFECCGWNNYTDWVDEDYPSSCQCDEKDDDDDDDDGGDCVIVPDITGNATSIYSDSCRDSVVDALRAGQLVIGAIAIAFAVIQFAVVAITIILCCCIHRAKSEYTTV